MIKKILNTIFKERNEFSNYRIIEIDIKDVDKYNNAIELIYEGVIDGILIKNVFSKKEIENINHNIEINKKNAIKTYGKIIYEGYTIPKAFPQIVLENRANNLITFKDYFKLCETFKNENEKIFGIDLEVRIKNTLTKITQKIVKPTKGFNNNGYYAFGTLRNFIPRNGNISVHCGNYFQKEFPEFYKSLEEQTQVKNQLSYTIKIKNEQSGGELTLYDLLWNENQTKSSVVENKEIIDGGKIINIDNKKLRRQYFKYNEGDMLVFAGGKIWHRVEHVKGGNDRITFGGFISKSKLFNGYNFWA